MLTEEAHHMFVGETGVGRVVKRTVELMQQNPNGDVRAAGGIDLATLQRYLNLWFTLSLDLFGGEESSNAAAYFATGLKGRAHEDKFEEHRALEGVHVLEKVEDGRVVREEVSLRNAMNEVLREAYIADCARGVKKWNRILEAAGLGERLRLPDHKFHRHIGIYAGHHFTPEGELIGADQWAASRDRWLPSAADKAYVKSLMGPVSEPGKMAHWIAPPSVGINRQPVEFEYVRFG
jgi:benzoyl-CoA 2,3-dioxygenase component B